MFEGGVARPRLAAARLYAASRLLFAASAAGPHRASRARRMPVASRPTARVRCVGSRQAGLGRHVKVGKGDTLSVLSRRYGVPVETIMGANDLSDGRLHIGQELVIPGAKAEETAEAAPAPSGETYKVQKGDTPHSIADKLGVSEGRSSSATSFAPRASASVRC